MRAASLLFQTLSKKLRNSLREMAGWLDTAPILVDLRNVGIEENHEIWALSKIANIEFLTYPERKLGGFYHAIENRLRLVRVEGVQKV